MMNLHCCVLYMYCIVLNPHHCCDCHRGHGWSSCCGRAIAATGYYRHGVNVLNSIRRHRWQGPLGCNHKQKQFWIDVLMTKQTAPYCIFQRHLEILLEAKRECRGQCTVCSTWEGHNVNPLISWQAMSCTCACLHTCDYTGDRDVTASVHARPFTQ